LRHQVGTAAQQVGRQAVGHRVRRNRLQRRRQCIERLRPAAHQLGQRMAGAADRFAQRFDIDLRLRDQALGLFQVDLRVQSRGDALAHQRDDLFALSQRLDRHGACLDQPRQVEVGAGHVGREQHTGGLRIGLRGAPLTDRRVERGALTAEQIEFPVDAGRDVGSPARRTGQRRRVDAVLVEALISGLGAERALRLAGRIGGVHRGVGHADARLHHVQRGLAGQRLLDQAVERGVAVAAPPARLGPRGRRCAGTEFGRLRQRRARWCGGWYGAAHQQHGAGQHPSAAVPAVSDTARARSPSQAEVRQVRQVDQLTQRASCGLAVGLQRAPLSPMRASRRRSCFHSASLKPRRNRC
jgi:hypothetical protein